MKVIFSFSFLIKSLSILSLLTACASTQHPQNEYNEATASKNLLKTSNRTVLFFLIDGLPVKTVQTELANGNLSQIKKYFLKNRAGFYQARTTFPSLTFPAIASLLTEQPTSQNGIYGNNILFENEVVDLASGFNLSKAQKIARGSNIFKRLSEKGLTSASFDYSFYQDATTSINPKDLDVAQAIQNNDYASVDGKLLNSLNSLLTETDSKLWPDFIFVHLIGVDFLSHEYGSQSKNAKDYLKFLDQQLGATFQILQLNESLHKREIVTLLSSDHGFDKPAKNYVNLEKAIKEIDNNFLILNEGRFISYFFPPHWSPQRKALFAKSLLKNKHVDISALRTENEIVIMNKKNAVQLTLSGQLCADGSRAFSMFRLSENRHFCSYDSTPLNEGTFYPFFISNLASYFQSPGHPDGVIISASGVSFSEKEKSFHGGPTLNETLVPLLIKNASIQTKGQPPALWELFRFL